MWKPPERIRHALPEPAWPTAEEAAARALVPARRGRAGCASRERTWVPAMVPWRATDDGFVTAEVLAWYERFARGEPGALVVEATGIRDVPSGPLLRVGDDRLRPRARASWSPPSAARAADETQLFLQIIDFLVDPAAARAGAFLSRVPGSSRRPCNEKLSVEGETWRPASALLTLADAELREVLSERELEHDLQFGCAGAGHRPAPAHGARAAARSCRGCSPPRPRARERAGFDGVELHFAHAYTMASFLSRANTRDDGYGGAREHRVRLPLEVLAAVRRRSASDFAVGCRFLGEERIGVEGGEGRSTTPPSSASSSRAPGSTSSRSRAAASSRTRSSRKVGLAAYPYTGPSGYECMPTAISDARGPFGRNVAAVAAIRAAVRAAGFTTPVVARRRHLGLRAGRGAPRRRRGRHRRRRAPDARRSRLVPEDPPRPRRRGPALHLHELLRGARPDAQAGDLPALGPRGSRRAGDSQVARRPAAPRRARLVARNDGGAGRRSQGPPAPAPPRLRPGAVVRDGVPILGAPRLRELRRAGGADRDDAPRSRHRPQVDRRAALSARAQLLLAPAGAGGAAARDLRRLDDSTACAAASRPESSSSCRRSSSCSASPGSTPRTARCRRSPRCSPESKRSSSPSSSTRCCGSASARCEGPARRGARHRRLRGGGRRHRLPLDRARCGLSSRRRWVPSAGAGPWSRRGLQGKKLPVKGAQTAVAAATGAFGGDGSLDRGGSWSRGGLRSKKLPVKGALTGLRWLRRTAAACESPEFSRSHCCSG